MFRLKSTRSLLVRSNYLRTPSSNNEIREALKYDDYATRLSASQNKLLKNNVVSWISQCRNEWELYDHNSIIRLSKSEKITCDLCNTKLRTTKVHIKNTLTGESLWIGTDCAQAMLNNEEHAQLAYTPEEQRYLEKFFSDNPTIEHFYKKRPSLTSEFILPSDFLAEEKKLITIIRTQISRKIVKGLPSTKINEINSKIADISSKINSFNAQV
ncbi:hypothetical protein, partial [Secundilactobacillus similis]